MTKVVVLGGGMGGLSAAFELASRGFDVEIYEKLDILGGKARSFTVPNTGIEGRPDLPAEHGFRVFPGWYAHVTNTMERIPYSGKRAAEGENVADRLVKVPYLAYAMNGQEPFVFDTAIPETMQDWIVELKALFTHDRLGIKREDGEFFIRQLLLFLGSSEERRLQIFENESWFDYIQADRSPQYERICANGMTRCLVATRPRKSSTYTVALILGQMIYSMIKGGETDRILNGPTSDVWIDSWVRHMRDDLGVKFHSGALVTSLDISGGVLRSAKIDLEGDIQTVTGDQFVCALPVDIVRNLLTADQLAAAGLVTPDGVDINKLEVSWMNGIMYYTTVDASMVKGHVIYIDSTWALTSVSQAQFWAPEFQLDQYGDGTVKDILSSIVSEWQYEENPADQYHSRAAIKKEAWSQISAARPANDPHAISEDQIALSYLDPDITDTDTAASIKDTEPLLTNTVGSIRHRPAAKTLVSNMVLASDYVNTYTNLATMEGANEAGRRAANAILDAVDWQGERAMVKKLEEPHVFASYKEEDAASFDPANPGEPPIAKMLDTFLGGSNWIVMRLLGLAIWLKLHAFFERIAHWLGLGEHYQIERRVHERLNR